MSHLFIEVAHKALAEGSVDHPAGFIVHVAFAAIDVPEPIGIFVGVGERFHVFGKVREFLFDRLILGSFLQRIVREASLHHREVRALTGVNAAYDPVQPHHHVDEQLRGLQQHGNTEELRDIIRLHASGNGEAVVDDARQLAVHVHGDKPLHGVPLVDRRHEDIALHVTVGKVAGSERPLDLLNCRVQRGFPRHLHQPAHIAGKGPAPRRVPGLFHIIHLPFASFLQLLRGR